MSELVTCIYEPSDVQQEAHACHDPDCVFELLYGGTAGCGKTWLARWDAIVTQLYDWNGLPGEHTRYLQARARGETFRSTGWALHLRRTFPMILQTISAVLDFAFKVDPGASWHAGDKILEFSCGYKYQFGHVQNEDDWRNYDSNDYTHLVLDEAIQFTSMQFSMLSSRVRTGDPILRQKRRIILASNPDAPVEGKWVKERFVDPYPEGRRILEERVTSQDGVEEVNRRIYIPAYLSDNPNKDFAKDYERTLRKLPRHIMEARLFNKWDVVEGAFFAYEFIPSVHVVEPYEIPAHWPRFRVMDWGYKSACPVMWVAVNGDGDYVFYREVTFNYQVPERKRKDAELVALSIKQIEQANGEWDDIRKCSKLVGPADYQIGERRGGSGPTIEEDMARHGVYWVKCEKSRHQGTQQVLKRLKDIPTATGASPGITIFKTCKHLIRTLPLMPTDPNDSEVPMDGGEDHWYDCLMYACMYRSASATAKKPHHHDEWWDDELARARDNRRRWGYGT